MFRSKKFKIFLVVLFALVASGGYYAYKEYNRRNPDLADKKADYQLDIEQVLSEFDKNDSIALKKYVDKTLEITGPVKEINKDSRGLFTIVLGKEGATSTVQCSIDSIYTSQASKLRVGNVARIRGECDHFYPADRDMELDAYLILDRCYPVQ